MLDVHAIFTRIATVLALLLAGSCCPPGPVSEVPEECRGTATEPDWYDIGFHAARDCPPAGWTGAVFHLEADYPNTPPTEPVPWAGIDYRQDPERYLEALLAYALDDDSLPIDRAETGEVARDGLWYHAPWLNVGPHGREFVHGLTRERTSLPGELHHRQKDRFQNWAVSVFNAHGGYALQRIWADRERPSLGVRFPVGTYAIKFLFTEAPVKQVPYLRGAPVWHAHIHRGWDRAWPGNLEREVKPVRLLQVDVAVKHGKDPTGWAFGTFVFHSYVKHRDPWRRLLPVGLAWGNGTGEEGEGAEREYWLNQRAIDLLLAPLRGRDLRHGFGYQDHLNGIVDNPRSSCLSCHATAQVATREFAHRLAVELKTTPQVANLGVALLTPPEDAGPLEAAPWFGNVKAGEPFTPNSMACIPGLDKERLEAQNLASTDYSLQVMFGIENFRRVCSKMGRCPAPTADAGTEVQVAAAPHAAMAAMPETETAIEAEKPVKMSPEEMDELDDLPLPIAREGRQ